MTKEISTMRRGRWGKLMAGGVMCSALWLTNCSQVDARTLHTASVTNPAHAEAASSAGIYKGQKVDTELLKEIQETLGKDPVNAKVDRVWHAVPGLYGWDLDVSKSLAATARQSDGSLRLVWNSVPPKTTLSSLRAEPIYRGPEQEKSVALMFNVSWGEADIPSLLSTLDKYHVKATFFLDGDWVMKNPQLAKDIAAHGQDIGSHGTGHPDFRKLSDAALERQITETNKRIEHTIGKSVHLLAPPAGSFDNRIVRLTKQHKMYTILWTVDTIDWNRPPANVIVKRVMSRIEPGSLVLMHPTPSTAAALPVLIERLTEQGYRFKTVDDVVSERPASHPPEVLRRRS